MTHRDSFISVFAEIYRYRSCDAVAHWSLNASGQTNSLCFSSCIFQTCQLLHHFMEPRSYHVIVQFHCQVELYFDHYFIITSSCHLILMPVWTAHGEKEGGFNKLIEGPILISLSAHKSLMKKRWLLCRYSFNDNIKMPRTWKEALLLPFECSCSYENERTRSYLHTLPREAFKWLETWFY